MSNVRLEPSKFKPFNVIFDRISQYCQLRHFSRYQQRLGPVSRPQTDLDSLQGDHPVTAVDMTRWFHREQNHILNTWRKWLEENLINSFEIQGEGA